MLHLLLLLLVLAGNGQTPICATGASFETSGLPGLPLGRFRGRRDVRLWHAYDRSQLPGRFLVDLAVEGVLGALVLSMMVSVVLRRKV